MSKIEDVLREFPENLQLPLYKAFNVLKEESKELIAKEEISKIWQVLSELLEMQKNSEKRFANLEQKMAELAEAQKRTEQRVNELAEAQKRTEQRVNELAEAQKRTEQRVNELAEAQKKTEKAIMKLTNSVEIMRKEFGSFQRTISYSFENEVYKKLPKFLSEKYNIKVLEKMIRMDIAGKEINFFAKAKKNGRNFCIVGEAKLKLDDKEEKLKKKRKQKNIFEELNEKAEILRKKFRNLEPIKILVCHFATGAFQKLAKDEDVIVIQSFDLD